MKNWWNNLKYKIEKFRILTKERICNKATGSKVKHFKSLQEMDAWIDKYGTDLVHLGILRYDILSPLILSCVITPETADETLASYPVDGNLRDMLVKLNEHAGEWCSDGTMGPEGVLVGVEVTQEDYYWILDDGKKRRYVSGAMSLKVREQIRYNIIRYRYI